MLAQITFQLLQKFFACCSIFSALRRIRVNPIEIVTADKKVAGETATVLERIACRFRQFERFSLAFRHLRRVDNGGCGLFYFRAGFFNDLFVRGFERGFHINLSCRAKSRLLLSLYLNVQRFLDSARNDKNGSSIAISILIKFGSITGVLLQYLAGQKFLRSEEHTSELQSRSDL